MSVDEMGTCPVHGHVAFRKRPDGYWRRLSCRSAPVTTRRRRVKATVVAEHGGRCVLCGYDRAQQALHFHHVDRATKSFHLSFGGFARSLGDGRAEASKYVLLCANCHAEVEAGVATLPASSSNR